MVDASGEPRPAWKTFIASLEALGSEELQERFARADQYLRDAGVYYRVYDRAGANEREWPLAHVPLLVDETEWADISAGLIERAELFEAICADIYGENRLVAEGLLPPGLIASSPEYLRPFAGVQPAGGHFLHFCAFDLGRGPNGGWWVLGDRMQAASGAGFALENRVATTRALSDIYGEMHVHRLAGFFRRFRDALTGMAGEPAGRAAILTPGPLNETYYEHAYIARYLGIMLLEGEDLTVTEGRLMVRTVSGLKPVTRAVAAARRRLRRSAGTARGFAHRHAGPCRGRAPGFGDGGECAGLGHTGDACADRIPARHRAGADRQSRSTCPRSRHGGAAARPTAGMCSKISTA